MEFLIIHLIVGIDRRLRPRLAKVIPDQIAILSNPAEYFSLHGGIQIGPRRYPCGSAVGGIPLGGILGLILGIFLADDILAVNASRNGVIVLTGLLGAMLGTVLIWHWSRGGELHLVPSGVVFSFRRCDVLVPWCLFRSESPARIRDDGWVECPLDWELAERIVLVKNAQLLGSGQDIQTSHVRVDRPGFFSRLRANRDHTPRFVAFADNFSVRPEEWLPFLQQIAWMLPASPSLTRPAVQQDGPDCWVDTEWERT